VTAVKTGGVDLVIQKFVEGKEKIDWKRNATFLAFGVSFQGIWQFYLFNRVMPRITPDAFKFAAKSVKEKLRDVRGMKNVLVQNFVENGINNPLLFFPTFYTLKEIMYGGTFTITTVMNAINVYRKNFWSDLTACWSVWIPAQTINFAFSPAWFRVPFVALVSAGWTGYVSLTRGSQVAECDVAKTVLETDKSNEDNFTPVTNLDGKPVNEDVTRVRTLR
jgi:hypothetical protein